MWNFSLKCDICGFVNPDNFAYCGRCGNGLTIHAESAETGGASIEGERKLVTIIFADISGFTALTDAATTSAEAEQVVQIVNHCMSDLSDVVHEFDGYIDKYIGDALMAIFGAPKAHEDDPERALRCALAMRQRLERFNRQPPFPLVEDLGIHIGINTGVVVAGLIGTTRKRSYTVMGDAVNVASRLEDVSKRGEILISEDTYRLVNRLFNFKEREPVQVKGKPHPLSIYELLEVKAQPGTQRGLAGLRSPMIGRDEQFGLLQERVRQLRERRGRIVTVVGEAGLGKSRLIAELRQKTLAEAQAGGGVTWLEGRGLSYRQSLSYRLFLDIVYGFLGATENTYADELWRRLEERSLELFGRRKNEVAPYLAHMLGLKLDDELADKLPLSEPHIMQQRTLAAVGELTEGLALQNPLILVFEDLHWADPSSVQLIKYLMTITPNLPILMICVTRPDRETDFWAARQVAMHDFPDHYDEINLAPLSPDESCLLVDQLLQVEQLPHNIESLIFSRSEGNPLFVEEVLRSLIEEGVLKRNEDGWTVTRTVSEFDIPETLHGVLTARIDRLDEPVKRVLQLASVIGRVFPRFIIAPLVEDQESLDEHLGQLQEAELIRERAGEAGAEYIFKHVLTMEAAYNSLLHQQRKIYHRQVGDFMARLYWTRGEEYASLVAEHYYLGEAWDRALTYLHRAAEASINAFQINEAHNYYARALEVLDLVDTNDPTIQLELYEGRGKMHARLGRVPEAIDDLERALALAEELGETFARLRTLNAIGALREGVDGYERALTYFERSLELAREQDIKPGVVDALNLLGSYHLQMGDLLKATACFQEGQELALEIENRSRLASSQDGLALVMLYQGELSASVERYKEIMQVRRRSGDHLGLMESFASVTVAYNLLGDYQAGAQICEEALALHDKVSNYPLVPFMYYFLAYGQFFQGDFRAAGENLSRGMGLAQQLGHRVWQVIGHGWKAYYHVLLGRFDEGLAEARTAVSLAGQLGSPLRLLRASYMLGVVHHHRRELADSQRILEQVRAEAQELGFAPDEVNALIELIQVYMESEQWARVPNLLERLLGLTDASEMREFMAQARWLAARYALFRGDTTSARLFLVEARDLARKTGGRLSEIMIESELARAFLLEENAANAQKSLENADQLVARLSEAIDNELLRASFQQSLLIQQVNGVRKLVVA